MREGAVWPGWNPTPHGLRWNGRDGFRAVRELLLRFPCGSLVPMVGW